MQQLGHGIYLQLRRADFYVAIAILEVEQMQLEFAVILAIPSAVQRAARGHRLGGNDDFVLKPKLTLAKLLLHEVDTGLYMVHHVGIDRPAWHAGALYLELLV